jgi:Tfp pilus assembly protein PilN
VLVVMVGALGVANRSVSDKKSDLARIERETAVTEAKAASLKSYADFRKLRTARAETVRSIAASRFDWSFVIHELARTVPANVWLTAVTGTVDPGVPLKAKPASVAIRSAQPTPALELLGCTTDQESVAKMMSTLRQVDGVRRVSLQTAAKTDTPASAAGGKTHTDCRNGSVRYPQFKLAIFFDARPAPAAPAASAAPSTTTTPATP